MTISLRQYRTIPDFTKPTPSRKHWSNACQMFISDPMSKGNSKLDKSLLIFDLTAVETCLNCSSCAKTCYARKSEMQYPATHNKRLINTHLARNAPEELYDMLYNQLAKTTRKTVRIHSSGDFFSNEYVMLWQQLALAFPHIQFYGYSKVFGILEVLEGFAALPNVNIVRSILPCGSKNYGSMEHIEGLQKRHGGFICPYGIEGKESVQCGTECTACFRNDFVYFLEH